MSTTYKVTEETAPYCTGWRSELLTGPDGSPSLRRVPILVVENDRLSAKLLSLLLMNDGAFVQVVASAEEAMETLETFRPRILLLDLVLPSMSGLFLIEKLKANSRTRDIAIVVVTSLNDPEVERRALAAGCAGYVRKPIDTFARTVAERASQRN